MTIKIIDANRQTEFWKTCLESVADIVGNADFKRWVNPLIFTEENGDCYVLAPHDYFVELVKCNGIWGTLEQEFKAVSQQKLWIKSNSSAKVENPIEAPIESPVKASIKTKPRPVERTNSLRLNYTFESFIDLSSNQLACTIAKAISKGDCQYNPLFIHSNPGLGKTHLLNAIANSIEENNPMRRSIYLQAVDFVRKLIAALRSNKVDELKATYQKYDILLIDDVQFFSGKNATMEQFFQLMNFFLDENRQVVLSSDKLPRNNTFPERIRSRLVSGLPIEISMPKFEDRVLLINQFAAEKKILLNRDIVYWIATKALVSVRDLKALLNPLQAHLDAGFVKEMTLNDVQRILGPSLASSHNVSPAFIIEKTAQFYSLRPMDLCGRLRRKKIAHARHMAMRLVKELTDLSVVQIGEEFNRDHSTVLHALRKIPELRKNNALVDQDFLRLSQDISSIGYQSNN